MDEVEKDEIAKHLGKQIAKYRKAAGFRTQQDLADRLNCSKIRIASWEIGKRTPAIIDMVELAELFGVSFSTLCGITKK